MRVWRISNYADLSGVGGTLAAGRWHNKGLPILYTAEHPAGALVEFLAHMDYSDIPVGFQLLTIDLPDAASMEDVTAMALPPNWRDDLRLTRGLGDHWLRASRTLALRVPSVIIPYARNILANPRHAEMASVTILGVDRVPLDSRLIAR